MGTHGTFLISTFWCQQNTHFAEEKGRAGTVFQIDGSSDKEYAILWLQKMVLLIPVKSL